MSYRDGPRWGGGAPGRRSPALGKEGLSGGAGRSHCCWPAPLPVPGGMWGPWGRHSGEGSPRAKGQRNRGCTTAELDPPVCSPRGPCRQRSKHPPAGEEREALSEERNPLEMLPVKLSLCCRNASRPELNVAAPGPWGSLAPAQRLSFTEHSGPCPDRGIRGHRRDAGHPTGPATSLHVGQVRLRGQRDLSRPAGDGYRAEARGPSPNSSLSALSAAGITHRRPGLR